VQKKIEDEHAKYEEIDKSIIRSEVEKKDALKLKKAAEQQVEGLEQELVDLKD